METDILPVLVRAFYLLVVLYFSFRFLKWLMKYAYEMKVINQIKGLPALPFIGNVHLLEPREKFLKQIVQVSRQYKDEPFFRLWIGWEHFIVFHKADHVDLLFSSSKNTQKSKFYEFLHPWLKTGLLTSYGDKWQYRRRLLTPSFHFEILNDFLLVMNDQANILVDLLTRECQKSQQIDIFAKMGKCALDIICETAMGQNVNAQNDHESVYVQAVNKITELIMQRQQNPAHWPDFIYNITPQGREHARCLKVLQDFTKRVIQERDAEFEAVSESTDRKRAAFLDILLKAKRDDPTITDEDIQEEVDTFMFEGHDTTTAAASWACHLIGSHPDVQKKLHDEVDSVFGDSNRPVTNDDFKELKYLDCVIKETLRLFPSVPFFARSISQDEQIGNYRILKDGQAMILAFMIHRDERYYPEPEKFDPDRFLPDNCKDRHSYAYIPFSAGRRNCIGQRFAMMEEKVLIANMMRNFEIKSLKTTEELQPVLDLILRPINGLPVELKLRSK